MELGEIESTLKKSDIDQLKAFVTKKEMSCAYLMTERSPLISAARRSMRRSMPGVSDGHQW